MHAVDWSTLVQLNYNYYSNLKMTFPRSLNLRL